MSAGKNANVRSRKLLGQCQTKLVDVVAGRVVIGGERHKNVGVRRSNGRGITVREIDAAVRQTNVVDDALDFVGGNLLSNKLLDQVA